jgi:aminoglycoside phosphotransferase (APT) family kinase protein
MDEQFGAADLRLEHGYTNATRQSAGHVEKSYLGPFADRRRTAEYDALTRLRFRFPVPEVVSAEGEEVLRILFVDGTHAQDGLTTGDADSVLTLCGETLALLHSLDPAELGYAAPNGRQRLVHGDFGPQNVLLDAAGTKVAAVIDWEFSHLGDPIEDLAMTEWVVRTHHPELTDRLPSFYAGYGSTPCWDARMDAMLRLCRGFRDFCVAWGDPDAVAMWDQRIAATRGFRE